MMKNLLLHIASFFLLVMGSFSLGFAQPCMLSHTLTGPLASDQGFLAQTTIASTQEIGSGTTVRYDAGTAITLSPGFIATDGCDFHAFIGGCNVGIDDLKAKRVGIANYPNPFTGETRIIYFLESNEMVTLRVLNALGQPVATLLDSKTRAPGEHEVKFDGSQFPAGVYLYTLQAGSQTVTGRMVLQK